MYHTHYDESVGISSSVTTVALNLLYELEFNKKSFYWFCDVSFLWGFVVMYIWRQFNYFAGIN